MNFWKHWLCALAWRILWRWWPDRVLYGKVDVTGPPTHQGWIILEVGTPSHPDSFLIAKADYVWEKLDHAGKVVKHRG